MHQDNKQPFYIIEGVDGAGKTTLGNLLSSRLNASFYERPNGFGQAMELINPVASPTSRFLFFLAYTQQTSDEVSAIRSIKPVVCVRYIYTAIVYHVIKGLDIEWACSIANSLVLEKPTKIIFLDVINKKERLARLNERGLTREDELMLDKIEEVRYHYVNVVKKLGVEELIVNIDTSGKTPPKVLTEAISGLK
ncbi:deoxynucleoside kinase [Laspinema olomoucense]|uniref:deoxynucleoside kinase n=1 Tax=Laspinema olomoucense TaxID=3231600 RepID=UPI0021BA671C|nr:deoxynucleoside kinase [Laspinema sp. D3c]MCT7992572.1 deoxynucleoside kinase [Laspinema sp. D3c]